MELENNNRIAQKKASPYAVKSHSLMSVKDVDTVSGVVSVVYNTYNFVDSDADVLLMGCSAKSISERGPKADVAGKIKHLLFHDWTRMPGKIKDLWEGEYTERGTKMKGVLANVKFNKNTEDGRDTLQKYIDEIYDNHSIGFRYLDLAYIDKESDIWDLTIQGLINPEDAEKLGYLYLIKEIMLYEGSTVAFGANRLTPTLGVKGMDKETQLKHLMNQIEKLGKILSGGSNYTDEQFYIFATQKEQLKQMALELFSDNNKEVSDKGDTRNEPLIVTEPKIIKAEKPKTLDFKGLTEYLKTINNQSK